MSLSFYDNYLASKEGAPTVKDGYKAMQQAIVNNTWDNGTLAEEVYEETCHGNFRFKWIEVWKNSISEFTTNIVRDEKDYRRLMFKDQYHEVERGRLYRFDDNFWMVYDPTSDIEPFAEVYVRRCNNYLKWIDKKSGKLHVIPCIIDAEVSSPAAQGSKVVMMPNGHIVVWVQANEFTREIKKNQRFIINGDPYKFTSYNNYINADCIDDKTNIIYMDMYLDEIQPNDDIEHNIANRYEDTYKVSIVEDNFSQSQGFEGVLHATVYKNGDNVDMKVKWKSLNDKVAINRDTGEYELIGESGAQGIVVAYLADNEYISDEITIDIESEIVENKEIVIDPIVLEVSQGETVEFNASVYINGEKQDDEVIVSTNNALDKTYYELKSLWDNNYSLTCKRISVIPLVLIFSSKDLEKQLQIQLTSMF